jgi:hypothetical protein
MATHPDIKKLRKQCAQLGKSFIYHPDEEQDEEEGQYFNFLFVGKDNGKEVIFDAYMTTLSYEYHMSVMDEADTKFFDKYPDLREKDFFELNDTQQAEYDKIVDAIYEQDLVKVQEDMVFYEDDEPHIVGAEVFLNVKVINDQVIDEFIRKFNSDTLELDDRMYSFAQEGLS